MIKFVVSYGIVIKMEAIMKIHMLTAAALCLFAAPAFAQDTPEDTDRMPGWKKLEQPTSTPEETQDRTRQDITRWKDMSPAEREAFLDRWRQSRQVQTGPDSAPASPWSGGQNREGAFAERFATRQAERKAEREAELAGEDAAFSERRAQMRAEQDAWQAEQNEIDAARQARPKIFNGSQEANSPYRNPGQSQTQNPLDSETGQRRLTDARERMAIRQKKMQEAAACRQAAMKKAQQDKTQASLPAALQACKPEFETP